MKKKKIRLFAAFTIAASMLFGGIAINNLSTLEVGGTLEGLDYGITPLKANYTSGDDHLSVVKAQISELENEVRSIRFVVGIKSANYKEAGFNFNITGKGQSSRSITRVYEKIQAGGDELTASQVFGEGYNYLFAYAIHDVPSDAFSAVFLADAYVVTNDGVRYTSTIKKTTLNNFIGVTTNPVTFGANPVTPSTKTNGYTSTLKWSVTGNPSVQSFDVDINGTVYTTGSSTPSMDITPFPTNSVIKIKPTNSNSDYARYDLITSRLNFEIDGEYANVTGVKSGTIQMPFTYAMLHLTNTYLNIPSEVYIDGVVYKMGTIGTGVLSGINSNTSVVEFDGCREIGANVFGAAGKYLLEKVIVKNTPIVSDSAFDNCEILSIIENGTISHNNYVAVNSAKGSIANANTRGLDGTAYNTLWHYAGVNMENHSTNWMGTFSNTSFSNGDFSWTLTSTSLTSDATYDNVSIANNGKPTIMGEPGAQAAIFRRGWVTFDLESSIDGYITVCGQVFRLRAGNNHFSLLGNNVEFSPLLTIVFGVEKDTIINGGFVAANTFNPFGTFKLSNIHYS